MDPPGPVLAATHRAHESLRLDDQSAPVQGNQQVDLPRPDFEIREHDGRAPVVGEQSFNLAQDGAFRLVLHQGADADFKRLRCAAVHRARLRLPGADSERPRLPHGVQHLCANTNSPSVRSCHRLVYASRRAVPGR